MSNGTKTILLIEDNPGDADLIRLRLVEAHSDVTVSCVDRLSKGLASIHLESPTMVLLDLNLPDSHGAETYRTVLREAPGVPVVVLSGLDDEELAVNAVHQGVQDYLVKGSFDSKQLARAMRYAIERQALLLSLDMSRRQQIKFKNDFLSHVSHELRTPLACIHQFVSLMLDGLSGAILPEQREHLETVFRSVNQLRIMITDLLEATRAESGKIAIEPSGIVIGDVIRQAAAMLRATAEAKGIGLEAGIDSRIPFVYADANRILQVLTNLIDNGIKFTPTDGSVMVKARLMEGDPAFVYISVADTGRGIDPEAKALIFERLYQDPIRSMTAARGWGLDCLSRKNWSNFTAEGCGSRVNSRTAPPSLSLCRCFRWQNFFRPLSPCRGGRGIRFPSSPLSWPRGSHPLPEAGGKFGNAARKSSNPAFFRIKDVIVPPLADAGQDGAVLMIVVSADEPGAAIVADRIREQLQLSESLECKLYRQSLLCELKAARAGTPRAAGKVCSGSCR